jgi:adenylate kinase family enzyme
LPFYTARGLVHTLDGMAPMEEVTAAIEKILRQVGIAAPA